MAEAATGNRILLLYKRSILVSGVKGKLPDLRFVALFSMARSCRAASISTVFTQAIKAYLKMLKLA